MQSMLLRRAVRVISPRLGARLAMTAKAPLGGSVKTSPIVPGSGGVASYSYAMTVMHWVTGGGVLACFGFVQAAMNTKDKKLKGRYMQAHKSWGLLVAGLVVPRVLLRMTSKIPAHFPGPRLEQIGGTISHAYLYAMLIFMPATGIAMGYYGGKGLPFFGYTIPGAAEKNGSIAKNAFKLHKQFGQIFEYFVPIHIGAVGYHHLFRGHNALGRMNPFRAAK